MCGEVFMGAIRKEEKILGIRRVWVTFRGNRISDGTTRPSSWESDMFSDRGVRSRFTLECVATS